MKANELRIGNYVICKNLDDLTKDVYKLDGLDIYTMSINPKYLDLHQPILLTKEWLLKFGFKKWRDEFTFSNKVMQLSEMNSGGYAIELDGHIYYDPFIYVHQLQNAYFDLIGKEL